MNAILLGLVAFAMLASGARGQTTCAIKVDLRWYLPPGAVIRWPTTGEPMKDLSVIRLVNQHLGETYWQETAKDKYPDICLDAEHAAFFVFWSAIPHSNGAMVRVFQKDKSGCVVVQPAPRAALFETDKVTNDEERSAKQAFKETLQFFRTRGNQPVASRIACVPPEFLENTDSKLTADKEAEPKPKPGAPAANLPQAILDISSNPAGADIELDGSFVGNTPSSLPISAGEHIARITKKGYTPWERKIKTTGGKISITADLEPQK